MSQVKEQPCLNRLEQADGWWDDKQRLGSNRAPKGFQSPQITNGILKNFKLEYLFILYIYKLLTIFACFFFFLW